MSSLFSNLCYLITCIIDIANIFSNIEGWTGEINCRILGYSHLGHCYLFDQWQMGLVGEYVWGQDIIHSLEATKSHMAPNLHVIAGSPY